MTNTKNNKKTLTLSLKKKWWDMIQSGEKTEEYREIKDYWLKRICGVTEMATEPCTTCTVFETVCNLENIPYSGRPCEKYDKVMFTLGYPKKDDDEKHMLFNIKEISIREGKEEWGAVRYVKYIVIELGEKIS